MTSRSIQAELMNGLVSGLFATAVMSVVMLAGRKLGPTATLPPKQITESVVQKTGHRRPGDATVNGAAVAAHFAFGGAAGATFGALRRVAGGSPVGQGVVFGLLVWALSYKGWIPALGIMPPPERDEPRRAWLMLTSHVVYGAVLGAAMGPSRRIAWPLRDSQWR